MEKWKLLSISLRALGIRAGGPGFIRTMMACGCPKPQGSKDPNNKVSGPKNYNTNALKPLLFGSLDPYRIQSEGRVRVQQ